MTPTAMHFEKYEQLAHELGLEALIKRVPYSKADIQQALRNGDEHLNTLPMPKWDLAAGYDWRTDDLPIKYDSLLFKGLSLAGRVCVLKHVAKHHIAN